MQDLGSLVKVQYLVISYQDKFLKYSNHILHTWLCRSTTMAAQITAFIFSKSFWLAENVTWQDLENTDDGIYKAQIVDLVYIFPVALCIYFLRLIFEKLIANPLGHYYGLKYKPVKASTNSKLEDVYKKHPYPAEELVTSLAKRVDLSERQVQRWFRRRRNEDRPTDMTKFTETAWRFIFYLVMFAYGLVVLWDKSWFSDVKHCWYDHPNQHVPNEIWCYYVIELGFYISLLFSQFLDVQRKDFWEQFIHHIVTILLMTFSWSVNYVRVGTLILCLHDAADYLLEGAKLARYINKRTLCDVLFGMFTLDWFITRLMIYPYVILWTTGVDSSAISGFSPGLFAFNAWLWVLQFLHIFWFVLIMKTLIRALTLGKVDKDVRSASEESEDATEPSVPVSQSSSNGNVDS